jgi:hypothetical protein
MSASWPRYPECLEYWVASQNAVGVFLVCDGADTAQRSYLQRNHQGVYFSCVNEHMCANAAGHVNLQRVHQVTLESN